MSEISIIIPVFNAENSIRQTILSVQKQRYKNWHLIVVNDGSTDSSGNIIREFALSDNRITLFDIENSGPAKARNYGIDQVKTPFVTFVDADDRITEDYLERLITPFDHDDSVDLVCAGYFEQNEHHPNGVALHDFERFKPKEKISSQDFIGHILNGLTGVLWSKLFKTDIIRKNNLYLPTSLKFSEDLIFVLRYAKLIRYVALEYTPLYYYNRLDEVGLSKNFDHSYFDGFKEFNQLVTGELPDDLHVKDALRHRTAAHLLKALRDQSKSEKNLKQHYQLMEEKFDVDTLQFPKSLRNRVFLRLLKMRFWQSASLWIKLENRLRKIKNA